VRLDWEIAKRGWRRHAAYPWATVAGVFTNTIFGFIQAHILLAVFRHRTQLGNYDAADAVTYVGLAQALMMTVYASGWTELALRIRDGSRSRPRPCRSRARGSRRLNLWTTRHAFVTLV
jgi:ABC-2 type transport system permease protein